MDIYPCVVDGNWSKSKSIRVLFGDLCSGSIFFHDEIMQSEQKMAGKLTQDDNMSSSYQSFSQSIDNESQYEKQGAEEMDKYTCYERFGVSKALGTTEVLETKLSSPVKGPLKREALSGGATDNELLYPNEKRIRLQVEGLGINVTDGDCQRTEMTRAWGGAQRHIPRAEESGVQVSQDQMQMEQLHNKVRTPTKGGEGKVEEEGRGQKREQAENGLEKKQYLMELGHQRAVSQCIESRGRKSSPPDAEDWLQQERNVNGPSMLNQDVEVKMGTTKKYSELQVASHRLAITPSVFEAISSTVLDTSGSEQPDPEALQEATLSALGLEGKTWWSVDLESTRTAWRYRNEEEL